MRKSGSPRNHLEDLNAPPIVASPQATDVPHPAPVKPVRLVLCQTRVACAMTARDVQIVTAVERRRKWSVEEKAAIVSESMEPDATVLAVARKYDVHPRCIYRW